MRRQKRIAQKVVGPNLKSSERDIKYLTKRKQKLEAKQAKGKKSYKLKIKKTESWLKESVEEKKLYSRLLNDIDTGKLAAGKDYMAKSHLDPAMPVALLANIAAGMAGSGFRAIPLKVWERNVTFNDGKYVTDPSRI